jgi:hypothetical protein
MKSNSKNEIEQFVDDNLIGIACFDVEDTIQKQFDIFSIHVVDNSSSTQQYFHNDIYTIFFANPIPVNILLNDELKLAKYSIQLIKQDKLDNESGVYYSKNRSLVSKILLLHLIVLLAKQKDYNCHFSTINCYAITNCEVNDSKTGFIAIYIPRTAISAMPFMIEHSNQVNNAKLSIGDTIDNVFDKEEEKIYNILLADRDNLNNSLLRHLKQEYPIKLNSKTN